MEWDHWPEDAEQKKIQQEAAALHTRLLDLPASRFTARQLKIVLQDPMFEYGTHHLTLFKTIAAEVKLDG